MLKWKVISDALIQRLGAGIGNDRNGLHNFVGAIWYSQRQQVLYVALNGDLGLWKTEDDGETWRQLNVQTSGCSWSGFSVDPDPITGDVALFRSEGNSPAQKGGGMISTDGGRTFSWFGVPDTDRHDGWSWGQFDRHDPRFILAKEHNTPYGFWKSTDSGLNWTKFMFPSRNIAMINRRIILAGVDRFAATDSISEGIWRTTNNGKYWGRVCDVRTTGKIPVLRDGSIYWTTRAGIIASHDEGRTWERFGAPLSDALYGPYFGGIEDEAMAITRSGFHLYEPETEEWNRIDDFFTGEGLLKQKFNVDYPEASFAWNAEKKRIYAVPTGGEIYMATYDDELSPPDQRSATEEIASTAGAPQSHGAVLTRSIDSTS